MFDGNPIATPKLCSTQALNLFWRDPDGPKSGYHKEQLPLLTYTAHTPPKVGSVAHLHGYQKTPVAVTITCLDHVQGRQYRADFQVVRGGRGVTARGTRSRASRQRKARFRRRVDDAFPYGALAMRARNPFPAPSTQATNTCMPGYFWDPRSGRCVSEAELRTWGQRDQRSYYGEPAVHLGIPAAPQPAEVASAMEANPRGARIVGGRGGVRLVGGRGGHHHGHHHGRRRPWRWRYPYYGYGYSYPWYGYPWYYGYGYYPWYGYGYQQPRVEKVVCTQIPGNQDCPNGTVVQTNADGSKTCCPVGAYT